MLTARPIKMHYFVYRELFINDVGFRVSQKNKYVIEYIYSDVGLGSVLFNRNTCKELV